MTNRTQIDAEQEFTQFVNGERKRTKGIPAELGDGNGVITHPTRSGFVKARLYGDSRQIISVRDALSVPAVENLPILVEKVITEGKYFYKYVGRNDGMSYASDPMVGAVGSHAPQHLRGDYGTGGFDPVDVYNRALIEVRAQAQATPNMTVYVTPGPYIVDGLGHEWAGGSTAAMVAPADTRCDLIYLGNDHALHILAGSDMAYPPTKPTIPVNTFPIAWIELTSATTSITETNIGNAKIIGSQTLPTTMPPSAHNILSASHGDTLADTVVRGDLIIGNATPKWARLVHPGSANRFLTTTANDVVWSAGQLYIGVNHLFNFAWDDDASAYVGSIWDGIHAAAGFYFSAGAILTVLTSGTAMLVGDAPTAHDMVTSHTYTGGAALDVFGLSAPNTIARLTPSADVSAGTSALLKSNSGALTLKTELIKTTADAVALEIGAVAAPNGIRLYTQSGEAPFNIQPGGATFLSTFNDVLYWGFNWTNGGAKIVPGVASMGFGLESNYEISAGVHAFEWNFDTVTAGGTTIRPMSFYCNRLDLSDMSWWFQVANTGANSWFKVTSQDATAIITATKASTTIRNYVASGTDLPYFGTLGARFATAGNGIQFWDGATYYGAFNMTTPGQAYFGGANTTSLLFDGGGGTAATQMVLNSTGDLGLGVASPAAKLDIYRASGVAWITLRKPMTNSAGYYMSLYGGATGTSLMAQIGITHTGAGGDTIWGGESADALAINAAAYAVAIQFGVGAIAMTLNSANNLLIGTTTDGMTASGSLAIAKDLAHRG